MTGTPEVNLSGHLALFKAQKGLCFHCNQPMAEGVWRKTSRPNGWTKEHLFPRSKAKNNEQYGVYNIVLAHHKCNSERHDRWPSPEEIKKARSVILHVYGPRGASKFDKMVDRFCGPSHKLVFSTENPNAVLSGSLEPTETGSE